VQQHRQASADAGSAVYIYIYIYILVYIYVYISTDGLYIKGTRAHTHRELIREWLWGPKGSSLEFI